MSTLTPYLRLRIPDNATADAAFNLNAIDALGQRLASILSGDTQLRSSTDIVVEPQHAAIGGSGAGGSVSLGTPSHYITLNLYTSALNVAGVLGLLDQAIGGTKYLRLAYESDLAGLTDGGADRTLSLDLQGANRSLILGGDLSLPDGGLSAAGGALDLTLSGPTALSLPTTGFLATRAGAEAFTNKSIDASANTVTNIANASISASAAIALSKLAALTIDRALISSGAGVIAASAVTATELGYLSGVTSGVQAQINGKVSPTRTIATVAPLTGGGDLSADRSLGIAKATASVSGYLAAADFASFSANGALLVRIGTVTAGGATVLTHGLGGVPQLLYATYNDGATVIPVPPESVVTNQTATTVTVNASAYTFGGGRELKLYGWRTAVSGVMT